MKKIVALILVCAMSFALFGCGKKEEKKGGSDKPKTEAQDDDKGGADAAAAATKGFTKEGEADEVDVLYAYIANGDKKSSEDYIFEFDEDQFGGLEDCQDRRKHSRTRLRQDRYQQIRF